ncbi:MobF family relaxase [Actinomadura kijaniata]|uniref:MobF family relaxase n=1 Tax=Actinomadura kijaniata TaxID=46161 RepID=UPI000836D908|nr:MobF family relaxase [Actinomadura kijaniata]
MAWLTTIGPDAAQLDYRLEESAGCVLEARSESFELHEPLGLSLADTSRLERLTWFGGGLADVGITTGTPLAGQADKDRARALMDGLHPETGEALVSAKRSIHPASKLPAAPLLHAVDQAAKELGVAPSHLLRTRRAFEHLTRIRRMVHRVGDDHRVALTVLEMVQTGLASAAGIRLDDLYSPRELASARAHRGRSVRVGLRGFDLTIDFPKSPSVVWALGDEFTAALLKKAFRQAVNDTLVDLERWCGYALRGQNGDGRTATRTPTSGLLGWVMWHEVARPVDGGVPDPHLHAHAVIAHLVRGVDGRWSTPANGGRELHRHVQVAGALAQARLRHATTELGFRWTTNGSTQWELAGVPRRVRELFSKRTAQTRTTLAALGMGDMTATSTAMTKAAAAMSREGKHTAPTARTAPPAPTARHADIGDDVPAAAVASQGTQLRTAWRRQALAAGFDPTDMVRSCWSGSTAHTATSAAPARQATLSGLAQRVFDPANGVTAGGRVATHPRLLAAVLDALPQGVADAGHAQALAEELLRMPNGPAVALPPDPVRPDLTQGPRYQTHRERYVQRDRALARHQLIETCVRLRPEHTAAHAVVSPDTAAMAVGAVEATRGITLTGDQRAAVQRLTTAGHGIDTLAAAPGTGRATVLDACRIAWQAAGLTVHGIARTQQQAQALTAATAIPSTTFSAASVPPSHGPAVLVVENPAAFDDADLTQLLQRAEHTATKVVLTGRLPDAPGHGYATVHRLLEAPCLRTPVRSQPPLYPPPHDDNPDRSQPRAEPDTERVHERVHVGDDRDRTIAQLVADWAEIRTRRAFASPHDELAHLQIVTGVERDATQINRATRALRRVLGEITGPDRHYTLPGGRVLPLAVGDHISLHASTPWARSTIPYGTVTGFRDRDVIVQWQPQDARREEPTTTTVPLRRVLNGDLVHATALPVTDPHLRTADTILAYTVALPTDAQTLVSPSAGSQIHLYVPRPLHPALDAALPVAAKTASSVTPAPSNGAPGSGPGGHDPQQPADTGATPRGEAPRVTADRPEDVPHWSQRSYGAYTQRDLRTLVTRIQAEQHRRTRADAPPSQGAPSRDISPKRAAGTTAVPDLPGDGQPHHENLGKLSEAGLQAQLAAIAAELGVRRGLSPDRRRLERDERAAHHAQSRPRSPRLDPATPSVDRLRQVRPDGVAPERPAPASPITRPTPPPPPPPRRDSSPPEHGPRRR